MDCQREWACGSVLESSWLRSLGKVYGLIHCMVEGKVTVDTGLASGISEKPTEASLEYQQARTQLV